MSSSIRQPPGYYPQDLPEDVDGDSSDDDDITYARPPPQPSFSDLPDYTSSRRRSVLAAAGGRRRHRPPRDHRFAYYDSNNHPWAQLRLKSPALKSKSPLPTYRPGDDVTGSVDLDLRKEKMVKAIELTVSGRS